MTPVAAVKEALRGDHAVERILKGAKKRQVVVHADPGALLPDSLSRLQVLRRKGLKLKLVPVERGVRRRQSKQYGTSLEVGAVATASTPPAAPQEANPWSIQGARDILAWRFAIVAYNMARAGDEPGAKAVARASKRVGSYLPQGAEPDASGEATTTTTIRTTTLYDVYENAMLEALALPGQVFSTLKGAVALADGIDDDVRDMGWMPWTVVPALGRWPSPRWYALHIAHYMLAPGNADVVKGRIKPKVFAELVTEMLGAPAWMDNTQTGKRAKPGVYTLLEWLGTRLPQGATRTARFLTNYADLLNYKTPRWWRAAGETIKELVDAGKKGAPIVPIVAGVVLGLGGMAWLTGSIPGVPSPLGR